MKKIPTLFVRDPADMSRVTAELHPDCGWVAAGEGVATRKLDGTSCLVRNGELYKRREIKRGKPAPPGFDEADRDEVTGKRVGWMPVEPTDKWHAEAWERAGGALPDGTYELLGPKVQGNPERAEAHELVAHADAETCPDAPTDRDGLREWLAGRDVEGLVWHHPDGRMAKIKLRDFGLSRP